MSGNTEKAMELADSYAYKCSVNHDDTQRVRQALRAYIEAMQKDCRTCSNFKWCGNYGPTIPNTKNSVWPDVVICKNHDQWQAVEFKQLTRSES